MPSVTVNRRKTINKSNAVKPYISDVNSWSCQRPGETCMHSLWGRLRPLHRSQRVSHRSNQRRDSITSITGRSIFAQH